MGTNLYNYLIQSKSQGKKLFALLIDPDKQNYLSLEETVVAANDAGVDLIFLGGSLVTENNIRESVLQIKHYTNIPVVLFPGSTMQFCKEADAILFLSLISGRNPDLLIGRHVEIAPIIRKCAIEVLPTGYMLIDSGKPTTASYISQTFPIPHDKNDIAACTAMAGELLGLKLIYLDGGSGASLPVNPSMIKTVRQSVETPIIVGGGIRNAIQLKETMEAGADVVVVGNAIEQDFSLIREFAGITQLLSQ